MGVARHCLSHLVWNVQVGLGCQVSCFAPVAPLNSPGAWGWRLETLKLDLTSAA